MLLTRRYRPKPALTSPITQAETHHLQRVGGRGSVSPRAVWIGRVGWGIGLLYAASVAAAIVIGTLLDLPTTTWWRGSNNIQDFLYAWVLNAQTLLVMLLFLDHLVYGFAALQMAASSIARERGAGTYDLLRLTLCSPRQIVRGKWRAVFPMYTAPSGRVFAYRIGLNVLLGLCFAFQSGWREPSLLLLPLIVWAVPILRLICGMYLAAVGVLVSAFTRSEAVASRLAFILLIVVQSLMMALAVTVAFAGYAGSYQLVVPAWRELSALLSSSVFVPLTGGFSSLTVSYVGDSLLDSVGQLIGALLLAGVIYGGLTWAALRLAEWRVARG